MVGLFIFDLFFSSPSCLSKYDFSENAFQLISRVRYCKEWLRLSILLYFLLTKLLGNHVPFVNITLITWFDNEQHKKTNNSLFSGLIRRFYRILRFLKQIFTISKSMKPIYPSSTHLHQQMKYNWKLF